MNYLKQSTAHTFRLGPFLDETDGKTAETALTIGDTDTFLSKAGGAYAAKNDTTDLTGTGEARGYYTCVLNTTDTETAGSLRVHVRVAGALPVWKDFQVVAANVFDSLYAASGVDVLDVSVTQNAGTAITAAAGVQEVKVASLAANAITAAATATDFGTEVAAAVWATAVDGSYTATEMARVIMATLGGQASGLGTTTAVYKNTAGTKTRVTATVDADGNRTSVVFTDLT